MAIAQRLQDRVLGAASLLVLGAWLAYLHERLPQISRGDFLLAVMRVSADFEQGRLLEAITWPLHVLGGHIIFYERILQLVNYYVLGYTPRFVVAAALGAWALLGLGLWRLVARQGLSPAARAGVLLLLALVTFNPIAWETLAWPDSVVPYLSSLVALLFVSPALLGLMNRQELRPVMPRLLFLCFLVIIGSGVGWSIVPAVMWVLVVTAWLQGRRIHMRSLLAAAMLGLAAAAVAILFFARNLRLGLVTDSLQGLDDNLAGFVGYFLSLFATSVGVGERPLSVVVGGIVFCLSLLVYGIYKWRVRGASEPELLFIVGLGSVALVALGRWKLNLDRGTSVTYYHLFALPAFYGAILMAVRILPRRAAAWLPLAASPLLAMALLPAWQFYDTQLRQQADAYRHMIPAVQNWRMSEATRLIGSPGHNDEIFFDYLPRLKEQGRYKTLSSEFHPYRSSSIESPVPTANPRTCSDRYRNLEIFEAAPDVRAVYTMGELPRPYDRFVGVARDPLNCDDGSIAVSLVDSKGVVLCRSATGRNVYWHFEAKGHEDILRSSFAFDFSCPMPAGEHYLVAQDKAGRLLEVVKVPR